MNKKHLLTTLLMLTFTIVGMAKVYQPVDYVSTLVGRVEALAVDG